MQIQHNRRPSNRNITYQLKIGFYGFTDILAEIQKANDLTLNNEKYTVEFLDDIQVVSHGKKEHHIEKLRKVLDKLDQENTVISIDKRKSRNSAQYQCIRKPKPLLHSNIQHIWATPKSLNFPIEKLYRKTRKSFQKHSGRGT